MNREFLMLSKAINVEDVHRLAMSEHFVSSKLDGIRAIWVPQTRGMAISDVPWANKEKKAKDYLSKVCTGLWSRYANIIHCPDWFANKLSQKHIIDGELWSGYDSFNKNMSAVRKLVPVDDEWMKVKFHGFDLVHPKSLFVAGRIKTGNYNHVFPDFDDSGKYENLLSFEKSYAQLLKVEQNDVFEVVKQHRFLAISDFLTFLHDEFDKDGEGVILRKMNSLWWPKRVEWSLKVKAHHDAEATVISWKPGVGKYDGMMGSLRVVTDDHKEFDLSGFDDIERTLTSVGEVFPAYFPLGTRVTYKYDCLTPDGVPRSARYLRHRPDDI